MLSIYRAKEIDLFENLDIFHIRLLVDRPTEGSSGTAFSYERGTRVHMVLRTMWG